MTFMTKRPADGASKPLTIREMKPPDCPHRAPIGLPAGFRNQLEADYIIEFTWIFAAIVAVYQPLTTFGKDWLQIRAGCRHRTDVRGARGQKN
ncbi:hypothetical protein JQ543_03695 [Bradyrhizobium diazoefficiens]|nr:hypothetical protein [Bradyrhizobium diazoefficiens]MBR0846838.1 hypothetical protein [Bradyrhizobium diazoefficiens]